MPLYDLLRRLREKAGLKKRELARVMKVSPTFVGKIELSLEKGGILPSNDFLRKLAEFYGKAEEEKEELKRLLLYEKYRDLIARKAPEIMSYLPPEPGRFTRKPAGMPEEFIKRVKKDLEAKPLLRDVIISSLKELTPEDVHLFLAGEKVIPRTAVIELAIALEQPVEEYLMLAEYLPDSLKEIVKNNRLLFLMRKTGELTPKEVEKILNIIENTLEAIKDAKKEAYVKGLLSRPGKADSETDTE